MKRIIRLTEKDLTLLVKRVIKETEQGVEEIGPEEISQFESGLQQMDYKLDAMNSETVSDLFDEDEVTDQSSQESQTGSTPNLDIRSLIEKRFNKKLSKRKKLRQAYNANKQYIDSEKEQLLQIFDKNNLCTKEGRRAAVSALKAKASQYLQKPNKNQNIEEQTWIPWSNEMTYLAIGTVLVILILIFWRAIIYGDGCRRYFRRRESWRY